MALSVDMKEENSEQINKLVQSYIETKLSSVWNDKMVDMTLQAVLTVAREKCGGGATSSYSNPYNHKMEVDIKCFAKVEKIPGGEINDSTVLKVVMFNKDTAQSKMRRHIEIPCILLLDCPLKYRKGELQTNIEIAKTADYKTMLRMEENYFENIWTWLKATNQKTA